jgi:hypothetical protein
VELVILLIASIQLENNTMAAHLRDILREGHDHPDNHASQNRWRHQESGSYARHAAGPRGENERHGSRDLADFFNSTRIEPKPLSSGSGAAPKHTPIPLAGNVYKTKDGIKSAQQGESPIKEKDVDRYTTGTWEVECGPLLNYRRMQDQIWYGSALIVTKGGGLGAILAPELILKVGAAQMPTEHDAKSETYGMINGVDYTNFEDPTTKSRTLDNAVDGAYNGVSDPGETKIKGTRLYSDLAHTFWRFDLRVPMQQTGLYCQYSIPGLSFEQGTKTDKQGFFVPAISESMRIMFHSCNGFSIGTDEDAWSGAVLWKDVLRVHEKTPFHVM